MNIKNSGFTLVELMIVVAVLAVIMAIALPAYNDYIETAEEGRLISNIESMQVFQEDFFLRNGVYAVGLADIAAIEAAIGWDPQQNDGVTYSIAGGDGTTYSVTAVGPTGISICRAPIRPTTACLTGVFKASAKASILRAVPE